MSTDVQSPAVSVLGGFCPPPAAPPPLPQSHWLGVLCLIGVDYFSSLAYQPSITFEVAGLLGPLATLVVVAMTLGGALPIYLYVAGRSPLGQGSVALLERLLHGWRGKTLIVLLLGFAATDFVMNKTLSLADAAEHMNRNEWPAWQGLLERLRDQTHSTVLDHLGPWAAEYLNKQMIVTILLGILGYVFWAVIRKGFTRKVITLSVAIVAVYLLLTAVVVGSGLCYLAGHPEMAQTWYERATTGRGPYSPALAGQGGWMVIALCVLFFPNLALGLSGFELGMIVMPQVRGRPDDAPVRPRGRIRNTRKLLTVAALVMSVYLLSSVLVTSVLIPPEALQTGGRASNRALAYLAHGGTLANGATAGRLNPLFGPVFGSLYDLSTVLILSLAGTSVMTSLQNLVPPFLLRFGMEFKWVDAWGVLFGLFALTNLAITLWFRASVEAQRGAYATGVLVVISSACVVAAVDCWQKRKGRWWVLRVPWGFGLIALLFLAATVYLLLTNPAGVLIALGFIIIILGSSLLSRPLRNRELRTVGFVFVNDESRRLWEELKHLKVPVLIPHRPGRKERDLKEQVIRQEHQLAPDIDVVFIEVHVEDASNFLQSPLMEVEREGSRFVVRITRCCSIAHAVAAVALELSRGGQRPTLHFGWTEMSLLEAMWSYLVFGEGNVPWRVRELLIREERDPARRPRVVIG
jgi:hypothetical protein